MKRIISCLIFCTALMACEKIESDTGSSSTNSGSGGTPSYSNDYADNLDCFETQYNNFIGIIKKAADFGADLDISIAVEPEPGKIVDTFEKAIQVFVEVDKYNHGIALNTSCINEDNADAIINDVKLLGQSLLLIRLTGSTNNIPVDSAAYKVINEIKANGYSEYVSDFTLPANCQNIDDVKKSMINFVNNPLFSRPLKTIKH